MYELPRNRPAVKRKRIKFTQFKRADLCRLRRITPSECDLSNSMEYRMGFAPKLKRCSGTLSKCLSDRLKLIRLYACGSLGQIISFVFGARVGHFAATPQSDVVDIWSRDFGVKATLSVQQKMPFLSLVHL